MARKPTHDEWLKFFIENSLTYEIYMLRSTYLALHIDGVQGVDLNVRIESFCIHARNLIEFFWADPNSLDPNTFTVPVHVINKQFLPGNLFGKICTQITHLSVERPRLPKIDQFDRRVVYDALEQEIARFHAHVRDEWRGSLKFSPKPPFDIVYQ